MALVEVGRPGRRVIIRQRAVEAPPYTNCRLVDAVRQLYFGGLVVPDKRRLIRLWREATGVPEVGPGGTQGTTAADLLRGAAVVLPWIPFRYGPWDDDQLMEAIAAGTLTFTAGVSYPALPPDLRRFSPRFTGKHAAGVADAERRNGVWWVWWVDGLRTDTAKGEWVRWSVIRKAMVAAGMVTYSGVWGMTLEKGAAVSTSILPERAFAPAASVKVPAGTKAWSYDPRTLGLVPEKVVQTEQTVTASMIVQVATKPDIPGVPEARMVRVESGPRRGQYLRVKDVTITEAPVPGDCAAQVEAAVAAAVAPRDARLAEWERFREAHGAVPMPAAP